MNHFYYDVSDLNARWDQVPLQGLGGGVLSAGPSGSLGGRALGATSQHPWREYSDATKQLQQTVNELLVKKTGDGPYCPIDADGKLGPATCGALWTVYPEMMPQTCKEQTAPKKPPCGGGSKPAPPPAPPPTETNPNSSVLPASMSSDNMWLIGGAVAAMAAVGLAVVMKKKKR